MRNAIVDQILMERMNRRGGYDGRDYARGDYGRGGYDGRRGLISLYNFYKNSCKN